MKNQKGMSLVEILVALGIVSVIVLTTSQSILMIHKSQAQVEARLTLSDIKDSMKVCLMSSIKLFVLKFALTMDWDQNLNMVILFQEALNPEYATFLLIGAPLSEQIGTDLIPSGEGL